MATGLNLLGLGLPSLLAVLIIPRLVHGLGEEAYGLFALAWTLTGYFTVLDLGISRAASRALATTAGQGPHGHADHLLWSAVRLQGAIGCLAGMLLFLSAPFLVSAVRVTPASTEAAITSVRWLAIALPLTLIGAVLLGALEGLRQFVRLNVIRLASSSLLLLLPLLAITTGLDVAGSVAALAVARAIGVVMAWVAVMSTRRTAREAPSLTMPVSMGALYRYGGWISISGIATPLLTQSDRFLISHAIGLSAVAAYAAPADVIGRLTILPASLVSALFPILVTLSADQDRRQIRRLVWRWTHRLALAMGLMVGVLIVLAPTLLDRWLGPALGTQAHLPVRILLVAALINGVAWVPAAYFQAVGRPDLPAISHLVQVPIYLLSSIPLIHQFDLIGAAMAAVGRAVVDTVVLLALFEWHTRRTAPDGSAPATDGPARNRGR